MYYKLLIMFVLAFSIILSTENASASSEPILITISPDMEKIIFDGKWTFLTEWKPSSLTTINSENKQIILRTAHYENFIYIFVDAINDYTLDRGSDKATICFDGENNKSQIPDENDFCFSSTLGHNEGVIFQGGSVNALTGHFQKIPNTSNFIAISSPSDENDRYSKIPHPSFEFKIPIELIQRSDNYGIFLSVYDASSKSFETFPTETKRDNLLKIPSPSHWGDILSPDKSLPELNIPILVFSVLILSIILVQSKAKIGILRQ